MRGFERCACRLAVGLGWGLLMACSGEPASAPRSAVEVTAPGPGVPCPAPDAGWRSALDAAVAGGEAGRAALQSMWPGDAACRRAWQAFYVRYLAYQTELASRTGPDTLAVRVAAVHGLRARWFSPVERTALFAEDEAYERDALARVRASTDGEGQTIADDSLPAAARAARRAAEAPVAWLRAEAAMRAGGASDADVDAERRSRFGAGVAARLATLAAEQGAWRERVDAYRRARQAIRVAGRDPAARAQALQALRAQHFDARERLRLPAYFDDE